MRDHTKDEIKTFPSGAQCSDVKARYDLICPTGLRRLAQRYALGAQKYSDYNWCKGIPIAERLNHLISHLISYLENGNEGDDNMAAIAWNAFAIMHYEHMCKHHEAPFIEKPVDSHNRCLMCGKDVGGGARGSIGGHGPYCQDCFGKMTRSDLMSDPPVKKLCKHCERELSGMEPQCYLDNVGPYCIVCYNKLRTAAYHEGIVLCKICGKEVDPLTAYKAGKQLYHKVCADNIFGEPQNAASSTSAPLAPSSATSPADKPGS